MSRIFTRSMVDRFVAYLDSYEVYLEPRVLGVLLLGFSSGLPILLILSTLSAWLADLGVDIKTIGLFGFVLAPYTLKFIWAPFMDRMPLPVLTSLLGRRRGWLLLTQLCLMAAIFSLGRTDPATGLFMTALMALLVAFLSASQDIVIDAFRIELLRDDQLAAGSANVVAGYRIGMLVAVAGALGFAEQYGWQAAYSFMAVLIVVGILATLILPEPGSSRDRPGRPSTITDRLRSRRWTLLFATAVHGTVFGLFYVMFTGAGASLFPAYAWLGQLVVIVLFAALFAAAGVLINRWRGIDDTVSDHHISVQSNVSEMADKPPAAATGDDLSVSDRRMVRLLSLAIGAVVGVVIAETLGLGLLLIEYLRAAGLGWDDWWPSSIIGIDRFVQLTCDLALALVIGALFVALSRTRPFREGAIAPFRDFFQRNGVTMALVVLAFISLFKTSDVLLTLMANPFYLQTGFTKGQIAWVSGTFGFVVTFVGSYLAGVLIYRIGIMASLWISGILMMSSNLMFALQAYAGADYALFHLTILIENLSSGMGTTAFVAYLASLCNRHYTAVQYALLTSFMQMLGKFVVVPSSGFLVDELGWINFFVLSSLAGIPALILLWWLGRRVSVIAPEPVAAT